MNKNLRLITALSIAGLTLISGCSNSEQRQSSSATTQTQALEASTNKGEQATKAEEIANDNIPSLASLDNPNPAINAEIQQYIKQITAKGLTKETQGVWMQAGNQLLANHRGNIPLPAASITKVATSLVALQTFGPEHQYITQIGGTGPIKNGVLQGDLVIEGGEDPLFVWEEAIALGNSLNKLGIKQVTGNLVIVGKFYMNFESNPQIAGNLLKQGLNSKVWSRQIQSQYRALPPGTPKPQVVIAGAAKVIPETPSNLQPIVRHYSFPLAELLKRMNRFSNNYMADMIADSVGGAKVVAQKAADAAGVPGDEIQLVNGSGLSPENLISPRAACGMFLAIERYLASYKMTIGDVFAVVGRDKGTLDSRKLPPLIVVKSGTLNNVSSLAGAFPTQKQGNVWFAIMTVGINTTEFRTQQENLLKGYLKKWGTVATLPSDLTPNAALEKKTSRSEIVK